MTNCDVRHQAGRRYRAAAQQVQQAADAVAPLVEEVTGLRLPPRPVIRVARVTEMIHAHGQAQEHQLERDARELDLNGRTVAQLRSELTAQHRLYAAMWPLRSAQIIWNPAGIPEIWYPPKTAAHADRVSDFVYQVMAHELTHLAQSTAGPLNILRTSHFRQLRGVANLALDEISEGHASWADREVSRHFLGHVPNEDDPQDRSRPSRFYRRAASVFANQRATTLACYDRGEAFVTRVVEKTGSPQVLDHIWSHPQHAPTHQEITDPFTWLARATRRCPPV